MCLSTVYLKHDGQKTMIMHDVAYMEYQKGGFILTGLLGNKEFVEGMIKTIDFVDDHAVVIETRTIGTDKEHLISLGTSNKEEV